jgi:hypothetical protein
MYFRLLTPVQAGTSQRQPPSLYFEKIGFLRGRNAWLFSHTPGLFG